MRLIGDKGEQLGVISLGDALGLAMQKDLDLVEVAPTANPPVCRILDYGKFRYEQTKKEKDARKAQKAVEIRQVRLRPKIEEHDMGFKSRLVQKFIKEGSKVKVSVLFRGREITHPELAIELLKKIAEQVKDDAKLEKPPAIEGRMMTMFLAPLPSAKKPSKPAEEKVSVQTKESKNKDAQGS